MRFQLLIFSALLIGAPPLFGADTPTPAAAPSRNAEVEKLIDQLIDVSTETAGVNSKATTMSKFLANDRPPVINSGLNQSVLPPTPPVMRKIVELGLVAVPSLLDHLTDSRDTKLVIWNPGIPTGAAGAALTGSRFGTILFNDEYDPRYRDDPARIPTTLNQLGQFPMRGGSGPGDSYTVRVGDLCYVLLGQIVDRTLIVARYQGTSNAVIDSPLHTPALAEAARRDWANLTPEQHRDSLVQDATGEAFHRLQFVNFRTQHQDAFERLAFYYPDAAKSAALKYLALPIAEWHRQRVTDFTTKYLAEPDAATRATLLTTAQKQWGNTFILAVTDPMRTQTAETPPVPIDAAGTLPPDWNLRGAILLHRTTTSVGGVNSSSTTQIYPHPQWDRATEMLKTVDAQGWVASFKGHQPVSLGEQITIIKALENIADPALDAACVDLFRRALALRDATEPAAIDATLAQLADACVARLLKNPGADQKVVDEIVGSKAKFHPPAPSSALP